MFCTMCGDVCVTRLESKTRTYSLKFKGKVANDQHTGTYSINWRDSVLKRKSFCHYYYQG